MKCFEPFATAHKIFDLPIEFYKKLNIKYVLCDLDNTLDAYYMKTLSEEAKAYYDLLKKNDIELIVVSNNKKPRVELYASGLGAKYIYKSGKPFKKKILNYLIANNCPLNECIMIGDQVMTDVACANKLKIKSVLCDNLVEKDQLVTKFNKFICRGIINSLKRKNKLIPREEKIYGSTQENS